MPATLFVFLKVKDVQLCLTLCDPIDCTVHGVLQARILEWVTFPFSRGSSQTRMEPGSPVLQADSLPAELPGEPKHAIRVYSGILLSHKKGWHNAI